VKRAAELRDLSEDHHHGLAHAQRLKKAVAGDEAKLAENTARAFLAFWQKETATHFRKEEEVLLPVLARYGEDVSWEPIAEMLIQHAQIRGLVMKLSGEIEDADVRLETLRSIGEQLEAHIRLEERQVFPMIEKNLPDEALEELASRLAAKESGPRVEPWVPTEGLSYGPWPGSGDSEGGGWD
jgi:hemerythrin-like domain-containing protein